MKDVKINGKDIKLKQTALTGNQVASLVKESINIYREGSMFDEYAFDPINMEINFYAGLFYLTIDEYNINNKSHFDELFSAEVHTYLLENIANAKLAYDLMLRTAKEMNNSLGVLLYKLNTLVDKFSSMDLNEMMTNMPDNIEKWQKTLTEYESITGKSTNKKGENDK